MRLTAAIFVHGSIVKFVQDIWIVVFLSYFSHFSPSRLFAPPPTLKHMLVGMPRGLSGVSHEAPYSIHSLRADLSNLQLELLTQCQCCLPRRQVPAFRDKIRDMAGRLPPCVICVHHKNE